MQHATAALFHPVSDAHGTSFLPPTSHSPASRQAALKSLSQMDTLPPVQGGKRRRQFFPGDAKQRENLHTAGPAPNSSTTSGGSMAQVAYSRVRTAGPNRTSSFDSTWPPADSQGPSTRPTTGMDKAPSIGMDVAMRRTTGSWVSVNNAGRGGGESVEEENNALREELARYKSGTVPTLQRRSMAAIAGGGFRGPSTGAQKQCMCDTLRAKLIKTKAELLEAREALPQQFTSQTLILHDMADASAQTSPRVISTSSRQTLCSTVAQPVRDAETQAVLPSPTAAARSLKDAAMQTVEAAGGKMFDAAVQVAVKDFTRSPSVEEEVIEEPEPPPETSVAEDDGLEDWSPIDLDTLDAKLPSPATPSVVGASFSDAIVQTEEAEDMQTAHIQSIDVEVQANEFCESLDSVTVTVETQTDFSSSCSDAAVQSSPLEEPQTIPDTCECSVQASSDVSVVESSAQTVAPLRASAATQASPPRGTDRSCQVEDKEARRKAADMENRILELEAQVAALTTENSSAASKFKTLQEDAEIWRQASLKNSLGQMNITILCPRAECTVNGDKIEMDSWNPAKLQQEFEREVLPRFANVFVEDSSIEAANKARGRPGAVERTMQEFAEIFRERLAAMLSAPNAAAAAAAASSNRSGLR